MLSRKAQFAVEFINLPDAAQIEGVDWEPYQIDFLNNIERFGVDVKSRQIGWSFTAALDAVVDGILEPGTPHVFTSINLDEAKEKIRYGRAVIDAIDKPVRPALKRHSQTEMEFENGSRLISHPCRPPRGKARARIYLDEMAHYPEGLDREIYAGALPATTKGDGYIRIGSSPLGARGLFWEIVTESVKSYPGFNNNRNYIPWWTIQALCKDVVEAREIAPTFETEKRVEYYGTKALKNIYENMFLEDFSQEYECHVASTLVKLADGTMAPIGSINPGDCLLYVSDGQVVSCQVTKKQSMGVRKTVSVLAETGLEFRATPDHKVVTSKGKQELQEAGDLCYAWSRQYSTLPEDALARVIGYNLGDGNTILRKDTGKYQISWFSNQKSDMDILAQDLVLAGITERPPRVTRKGAEGYHLYVTNQHQARLLVEKGCIPGRKKDQPLVVPDWIMNGPQSARREFMAALWGAEGTTPIANKGRVCNIPVLYMYKGKEGDGDRFFSQLSAILDEFGIRHSVKSKEVETGYKYALFILYPVSNLIRFFDTIGFRYAEDKERTCFFWIHYLRAWWFDSRYRRKVIRQMHDGGMSYAKIGKELGVSASAAHTMLQRPPTKPTVKFPHFKDWLCSRIGNNCVYVNVLECNPDDDGEVFNITVDSPDHSYVLGDGLNNYNCNWVDESVAWMSWDLIKQNQAVHDGVYWKARGVDEALQVIPEIQMAMKSGRIESTLVGGIDVGRHKHLTEFVVLGESTARRYPVRLRVSLSQVEFDDQQYCFSELLHRLPFKLVYVDRNGLGEQLAENLERDTCAQGALFSNASKEMWAVEARIQAERTNVPLPDDRDMAYQIHSIKKKVTQATHNVFDTERNTRHHADVFWAWALAIYAAVGSSRYGPPRTVRYA